jgi:hypothetical protein
MFFSQFLQIFALIIYLFWPGLAGLDFAPMLAWPRLLASRSVLGLLTPPKAPWPEEDCGRFACWVAGRCDGWVVGAGRAEGCVVAAGLDALVFPAEGRAFGVLAVVGRVAPGCPYPRSLEGFRAGVVPVLRRLLAPALAFPGAEGLLEAFPGALRFLLP